jgi:cobalt/nickel transport system permease protein
MQLFAVHVSDGVLAWPWMAGGWAVAAVLVAVALRGLTEDEIPRVGVLTAALFVATLLHLPFAGPVKVHLLLNSVAGVILGRRASLAVLVAVAFQAILFVHGGFWTIGLTTAVIGLPAVVAGAALIRLIRLTGRPFAAGIVVGGLTAASTVGLNAAVLWFGGVEDLTRVVQLVLIAHVPVVLTEAAGTGVIVAYFARVKPEWLAGGVSPAGSPRRTAPPTGPDPGSPAPSPS